MLYFFGEIDYYLGYDVKQPYGLGKWPEEAVRVIYADVEPEKFKQKSGQGLTVSLSRMFHALVLAHTEGFPQSENVTAFREVGIRLPTWKKTQFATKWGIRLPTSSHGHFMNCVSGYAVAFLVRVQAHQGMLPVTSVKMPCMKRENAKRSNRSPSGGMSHEIRWEYMARFAMRCCCENPIDPLSFPVQESMERTQTGVAKLLSSLAPIRVSIKSFPPQPGCQYVTAERHTAPIIGRIRLSPTSVVSWHQHEKDS